MKKISSWRFSRIWEHSAWKRLSMYRIAWTTLLVLTLLSLTILTFSQNELCHKVSEVFLIVFLSLLIYKLIDIVLGADEFYHISLKTKSCSIYVYRHDLTWITKFDIFFVEKDQIAHIETMYTCLEERGFCYKKWKDFETFMYCPDGNNNHWYCLNAHSDKHQLLGKKMYYGIGDTVFLLGIDDKGKQDLRIWHNNTLIKLKADCSVMGAYVPPIAAKNIKKQTEDNVWIPANAPDEYLIIENDGKHSVYGIYDNGETSPECWPLSINAIIYEYLFDRVVLVSNKEGEYDVLCRKKSITRVVNDVITELTDTFRGRGNIGGIVWRFDEEDNSMHKLYEGSFRAIGFADGSVVGDGWEYTPTYN